MNAVFQGESLDRLLGNGKIYAGLFTIKVDGLAPLAFTNQMNRNRFVDEMRALTDKYRRHADVSLTSQGGEMQSIR